jgi:hypothetical protein
MRVNLVFEFKSFAPYKKSWFRSAHTVARMSSAKSYST